jgi:hypothetical protein
MEAVSLCYEERERDESQKTNSSLNLPVKKSRHAVSGKLTGRCVALFKCCKFILLSLRSGARKYTITNNDNLIKPNVAQSWTNTFRVDERRYFFLEFLQLS